MAKSSAFILLLICLLAVETPLVAGAESTEVWLKSKRSYHHESLLSFLAIPSVSSDPNRRDAVRAAAVWLRDFLTTSRVPNVRFLDTEGAPPAVFASRPGAPGAPTLLIYGHYDVQPEDPVDEWTSPPFKPTVRDGRIYARGASDDKGNVLAVAAAMAAYSATVPPGKGVAIKVLFEGEEEIGSPHMLALLEEHRELLEADYAYSADGGQISRTQPGICLGLRGSVAVQVDVFGAREDAHSGMYGGAVQNPLHALAELIGDLHGSDGAVTVPGFYDDVREVTTEDRELMSKYAWNVTEALETIGARAEYGEKGFSFYERVWLRPTLEVVGMWGGFTGAGLKTVLPKSAHAKLSMRLVGTQTPLGVGTLVKEHIEKRAKKIVGVKTEATMFPVDADPFEMEWNTRGNQAAREVLTGLYGVEPVAFRIGGSIPFMFLAKKILGLNTTMFAITYGDANLHAPNENWEVKSAEMAEIAYVRLFKWFEDIFEGETVKTEL